MKTFLLRSNEVGFFNGLSYPLPKHKGCFPGLSCSTSSTFEGMKTFLGSESFEFVETKSNLKKKCFSNDFILAVSYKLSVGDQISLSDFLVDYDRMDVGKNHVSITVNNANGIASSQIFGSDKVRIEALENLPWQRGENVLVFKARVDWRDDFLPDNFEWLNVLSILNKILSDGEFYDKMNVLLLHDMIERIPVGHEDVRIQNNDIFRFAQDIIDSFLNSEAVDINDNNRGIYSALENLNILTSQV